MFSTRNYFHHSREISKKNKYTYHFSPSPLQELEKRPTRGLKTIRNDFPSGEKEKFGGWSKSRVKVGIR